MKKLFYLALIALVSVAFTSCGSKSSSSGSSSDAPDAYSPANDTEEQIAELGMAAFKAVIEGGDLAQYTEPGTSEELKAGINQMNKEDYERDHNEFGMVVKNARITGIEVTPEFGGGGITITYDKEYTKVEGAEPTTTTCSFALKEVDGKYYILSETLNHK